MRQTLFFIPNEVFRIPLFGMGLLFMLWALFSVGLLIWLVRRHGFSAETRGYIPILIVAGAVIAFVLPLLADADRGLPIRGYGMMMLAGVLSAVWLAARRARAARFDPELIFSLSFWAFAAGIAGARLFHVIQYWNASYRKIGPDGEFRPLETLWAILNVPGGGLVVYGSLIAALMVVVWFVRRHKLPGLALTDLIAPSLLMGLALGRIGCLLNGCCYGDLCERSLAVTFPRLGTDTFTPPYEWQVEHAWLFGIHVGVEPDETLIVRAVRAGSEAERLGLEPGTAIAILDGKVLTTKTTAGEEITVRQQLRELFRRKADIVVRVVHNTEDPPAARPDRIYLRWQPPENDQDLASLDPVDQFLRGLGVRLADADGGVILAEVIKLSEAKKRGLRALDHVVGLDGKSVRNLSDARAVLMAHTQLEIVTAADDEPLVLSFSPPPRTPPVHPTQIYSAINATLICLFLLAYHPFRRHDGEILALLLTIYPITRFLLEMIRTDEAGTFGTNLSISQWVSIAALAGVTLLWWHVLRQPAGKLWAQQAHSR